MGCQIKSIKKVQKSNKKACFNFEKEYTRDTLNINNTTMRTTTTFRKQLTTQAFYRKMDEAEKEAAHKKYLRVKFSDELTSEMVNDMIEVNKDKFRKADDKAEFMLEYFEEKLDFSFDEPIKDLSKGYREVQLRDYLYTTFA